MTKHEPIIIAGVDGGAGGDDALSLAGALAAARGARVVAAFVYARSPHLPSYAMDQWERLCRANAAAMASKLAATEVIPESRLEVRTVGAPSPARGLQDLATELDADTIVVGASRRSKVDQAVIGNVGQRLIQGAPCSVVVAAAGEAHDAVAAEPQIVVAWDGSAEASLALERAAALAEATGGRVRVVAVAERVPRALAPAGAAHGALDDAIAEELRPQLESAVAEVRGRIPVEAELRQGDPAQELRAAAAGADLLVMGSRGRGPVRRALLGSVSGSLATGAPCSVMVAPRGTDSAATPAHEARDMSAIG